MIICCGEALIDMLPRQLSSGEDVFFPVSGGAIFNTAIALGRLGEKSGFISGISTDMFGDQLMESLAASHVETGYCVRKANPSTLAFVKLVDGHAEYSFFDENSAGRMLSTGDLSKLPDGVSALHFGAISLIPEPCGSAYEELLRLMAPKTIISLDPNIRQGFIDNPNAHRQRISRMAALSDIIKVSDEDLNWLREKTSSEEMIDSWLKQNASIIVMTRGAEGAQIFTRNGMIEVAAVKAKVVDTVGAGDTFNAGFLAGLRRQGVLTKSALVTVSDEQVRTAGNLAAKVAAITVARAGANPPWQKELD